jgi:hypothetical protein
VLDATRTRGDLRSMEERTQDRDEKDEPASSTGYVWHAMVTVSTLAMILLALSLWRRMRLIDPVERCAHAYWSSYNPVDTMLVDRMKVRAPDGNGRTTCEVLRKNGAINRVPKTDIDQTRMP